MSDSNQPLFRLEALTSRATQWTGSIVLRRPVPIRIAAGISFALTVALICFVGIGRYTRSVHVIGQLVPSTGAIKVAAPQFAHVTKKAVQDGDTVKAGQLLYELSSEREGERGGIDSRIDASLTERRELLAQERNLQAQQLQQHQRMLNTRRQLIESELGRVEQEIGLAQQRVISSAKTLERYKSLRERGFVSEFQLTQYENDYSDQLSRVQDLERAKLASTRDSLQTKEEAEQVSNQIHLNSAQSDGTIAALEQETAEHQGRSRIQITAPEPGVVSTIEAEAGQPVSAGTILATIIPTGSQLEAHLLAPSHAIGFVEVGQSVFLRISAFPYQKFGQVRGIVTRVEQSPAIETEGAATGNIASTSEPMYRVIVQIRNQFVTGYGKTMPFRAGMSLEAEIHQDRRRLIDWVLDPILSVAKGRAE